MTWNYRVLVKEYKDEFGNVEQEFAVHEVYYNEDRKPIAYRETPSSVIADSKLNLLSVINVMKEGVKKPILWFGERFPEIYKISEP